MADDDNMEDDNKVDKKAPPVPPNSFEIMENVLEILKMLNYEDEFANRKGLPLFSHTYFAIPAENQSNQFSAFLSLVSWLVSMSGNDFTIDKYDDPNTSVNKLMLSLKNMGFDLNFPAAKLKTGNGEAITSVLMFLCESAMKKRGFVWKTPIYPEEDFVVEGDVEDNTEGDDAQEVHDEEEDEEVLYSETVHTDFRKDDELERSMVEIMEGNVNPILWKTELESVGPRLKATMTTAGKEWRSHIEATKKHQSIIAQVFPSTSKQLESISVSTGEILDRVVQKEGQINSQLDHLTEEYKSIKAKLDNITKDYQGTTENIAKLTNELAVLTDKVEEIKTQMDDKGASMTDTSPLVKIKGALTSLKSECKELELRIGVVGHSLMQAKNRQARDHHEKEKGNADGTSFEIEEDDDAEMSLSM